MLKTLRSLVLPSLLAALLISVLSPAVTAQSYTVTVSAGAFDRSHTPVRFPLPDDVAPGTYRMKKADTDRRSAGSTADPTGSGFSSAEELLLQVDEQGRAWFILDALQAGTDQTYELSLDDLHENVNTAGIEFQLDERIIVFYHDSRSILNYYHGLNEPPAALDERYRRGGYIHPLYSPEEVVLTNHLNVDGHPHHSGIWSAWTNTRFQGRTPDFWNPHVNTGRVNTADTLQASWEGVVQGGFRSRHDFVDLSASSPVTALNEQWEVMIYKPETRQTDPSRSQEDLQYYLIDLEITQSVNTAQPLELPEYRYGGVGFRGHEDWDDPDNVVFLTSEGEGREGNEHRARWIHIGGHSNGQLAGVAILGHPENFRHPQTMRIHPDEPFFNFAPTQLGEMAIQPGKPYRARYRYITYDGEPNPEELERLWSDYAYPPGITVIRHASNL